MNLNWDILKPVDVAGNIQAGFQLGTQMVEKARTKSALAAYAANPTDPGVQNALAALSPQFAMQMGEHRARLAEREAQQQQYGSVLSQYDADPQAGRRAALQTGNPDIIKTIQGLADDDRKRLGDFHEAAAPYAYKLKGMPKGPERIAFFEQAKPVLIAQGADERILSSFDPNNDEQLETFITRGQTVASLISAEQLKAFNVGPGEGRYAMGPDGKLVTIVAPNTGGQEFGQPVASAPPKVADKAGYDAIPPGGAYMTPDGKIRQKPGGQTQPASGNFPDPLAPL